ncbi:MAG TPA: hypothetical protein VN081_05415 [Dongiaceae bacterium]|nr:hypothetical protein [Dongiaceae bacterium]
MNDQNGEHFRLTADISRTNAEVLKTLLRSGDSPTVREIVQRATALHAYAAELYAEGGGMLATSELGVVPVPLFDNPREEDVLQNRVQFAINLNKETAHTLESLGLQRDGSNTRVLDNVINLYSSVATHRGAGHAIWACHGDGSREEIPLP